MARTGVAVADEIGSGETLVGVIVGSLETKPGGTCAFCLNDWFENDDVAAVFGLQVLSTVSLDDPVIACPLFPLNAPRFFRRLTLFSLVTVSAATLFDFVPVVSDKEPAMEEQEETSSDS
mmetsp:Transcript_8367/g.16853  ORF Transcript_8367/g.16853 Transcript_8367/m.16853 type:complete len:120 (-) Transcript_8367:275-634(-)